MRYKKLFVMLLCIGLICSLSACSGKKEGKETNDCLDEVIYANHSIRELLKLSKEQDIEYAGKFIDEKGILNIALVYKTAKKIEQKELEERISNINNNGVIKISDAQFSFYELQNANNALVKNMKKLGRKGLIGIEIDEKKNRIIVTVKRINEDIKKRIGKLVDISIIIFEEGITPTLT